MLDEDNVHEGSKYYALTELAAQCTSKRMVPDYISAKIMKELKGTWQSGCAETARKKFLVCGWARMNQRHSG